VVTTAMVDPFSGRCSHAWTVLVFTPRATTILAWGQRPYGYVNLAISLG